MSTDEDQSLLPEQIARIAVRWYIDGVDELILQVESSEDQPRISSEERKEVIDAFVRLWPSGRDLPLLAIDGDDVDWKLVTR